MSWGWYDPTWRTHDKGHGEAASRRTFHFYPRGHAGRVDEGGGADVADRVEEWRAGSARRDCSWLQLVFCLSIWSYDRSPDEEVMIVLHKSRIPERNTRPGSAKRPGSIEKRPVPEKNARPGILCDLRFFNSFCLFF